MALWTLLLALLLVAAPAAAESPTVIVVSWDGVRHDYPELFELPALGRLEREGARAERLVPPFPSSTFPAHVSLATGTHPDRHGIVDNRFLDPERGLYDYESDASWIEAEPLWVAAERQGVRSAVFFWVGSETDWHGIGASYRRAPFDGRLGEAAKVDQLLAWLDLPEPERPRLLMSWWHGADRPGHRHGPRHRSVAEALARQDAELGRLLAGIDARGLWPATTLLLVSDHGMTRLERPLDPRAALEAEGVAARVELGGGVAHVYLENPGQSARAQDALASLAPLAVHTPGELPGRLRAGHRRMGDLVLTTDPPHWFAQLSIVQRWWVRAGALLGRGPGGHGFDPEHPDMGAIFFALGRGVDPGARLPAVYAVDLAPTVAALLGIEPPRHSEGRALFATPRARP